MSATFSKCGKYRYVLRRSLEGPSKSQLFSYQSILFIMLNPSTADADTDDATIRRCMQFGIREGMTHLSVVNLFAYISTFPRGLKTTRDPIGFGNDAHIQNEVKAATMIVAAWGYNIMAESRGAEITKRYGPFNCLGKTKKGAPRHPLYVRGSAELEEY